jgi:G:T-mismatch repair DNA endonuclease (very short patch repair protein)
LSYWLKKFSEDIAIEKHKNYKSESRKKNYRCIEYWLERGHSKEDAIIQISKLQNLNSKEAFQKRYGKDFENKYSIFKENIKKTRNTNINFYLSKGYSLDESQLILHERQKTFSLTKCIEKYGEDLGYLKWKERQDKWQKSMSNLSEEKKQEIKKKQSPLNLEHITQKYGEKKGLEIYNNRKIRLSLMGAISSKKSKESKNFFEKIELLSLKQGIRVDMLYHDSEYIIQKSSDITDGFYSIDFFIPDLKFIIEFNGIFFHPKEGDINWENKVYGLTYESSIKTDKKRLNRYKELGIEYHVVWSDDNLDEKAILIANRIKEIHEENQDQDVRFV